MTAALANILTIDGLGAFPIIIILFVISAIATLFLPGSTFKWAIMAGIAVPAFMNVELSPEFAQTIFRFGECVTMGLTPLATYYVIYLAYLEKYNPDNIFRSRKNVSNTLENNISEGSSIIEYKEKNFIQKIFEKIKHLFKRKY